MLAWNISMISRASRSSAVRPSASASSGANADSGTSRATATPSFRKITPSPWAMVAITSAKRAGTWSTSICSSMTEV
jgi:hypothetical protein